MKFKLIISILTACSAVALSQTVQANKNTPVPASASSHLASDFAHYSFPLSQDADIQPVHQAVETSSDEYWFQATGDELNRGVEISSTQAGSLIRITRGKAAKGLNPAAKLDKALIKLVLRKTPNKSVIGQLVSQSQLEKTGVFDRTLAIKTSKKDSKGPLLLSTSQALNADDKYMISVKEKNSPYRLKLTLPSQSFGKNNSVKATAHLASNSLILTADEVSATLIAPDGQQSPINFSANKKGELAFNFNKPLNSIAPVNGLYEILVKANGKDKGLSIKRNAKLALAFSNDTARLAGKSLDVNGSHAIFKIDVAKESRFEVRAVLYGTDLNGKMIPVMETHAAQSFKNGLNQLELPFNAEILAQSQASAPFELRNVRLFDQKQLGLIDTL